MAGASEPFLMLHKSAALLAEALQRGTEHALGNALRALVGNHNVVCEPVTCAAFVSKEWWKMCPQLTQRRLSRQVQF